MNHVKVIRNTFCETTFQGFSSHRYYYFIVTWLYYNLVKFCQHRAMSIEYNQAVQHAACRLALQSH